MGLVRNGLGLLTNPMRSGGSANVYGLVRSDWTRTGSMLGLYGGEATVIAGASIADTSARPNGYEAPYSWLLAPRGGGLSAYNTIQNDGTLAGAMAMGVNADATLSGDGSVSTAQLSLIVSLACTALSGCAVTATMQSIAGLASTMAASGDLSGALSVIAFMVTTMTGNGSLDGSTLRGTSDMSAELTSAGDAAVATPAQIAAAVWADLAALTLTDDVSLVRKTTGNRLEVDLVTQRLNLYDDDGTTVLRYWPLTTDGGELVETATGIQTKRGAPV